MMNGLRKAFDMARLVRHGGPSICNIAVTNVCNATCDFCNFAYDKGHVTHRAYVDFDDYGRALDILYRRGVRYLTFQGGEPLLHPRIVDMVAMSTAKGLGPALITNGWLLPKKLAALGSSSLVDSEQSPLVDFTPGELIDAFQAVDGVRGLMPVQNPRASLEDMQRHVRGEPETFPCFGGFKHFFLDWKLDLYRCEA